MSANNPHWGPTLDEFLTREGIRETVRAEALARVRHVWDKGTTSGDAGPVDFVGLRLEARERLTTATKPAE